MAVSERDKKHMRRLGDVSRKLSAETGWDTPESRREEREWINERRAVIGMPPFEDEGEGGMPPELGFYGRARARGLLRARRRPA